MTPSLMDQFEKLEKMYTRYRLTNHASLSLIVLGGIVGYASIYGHSWFGLLLSIGLMGMYIYLIRRARKQMDQLVQELTRVGNYSNHHSHRLATFHQDSFRLMKLRFINKLIEQVE